ncbi:MAG: hypothetical protein WA958_04955 [Tunicatimonas sp.]
MEKKSYHFETEEFGLSDEGVHLLRSRYNYDTIAYQQIMNVRIEKDKELNNWLAILIIGIGFLVFSVYYAIKMYLAIQGNHVRTIYIEYLLVPVIPFMLGGYCVYAATRSSKVLKIRTTKDKRKKLSLASVEKQGTIDEFVTFITGKLTGKVKVNA